MSLRIALTSTLIIGFATFLAGCGGSGKSVNPIQVTQAHFNIAWAARSKAIQGPSSALSATVTLPHAAANSADVVTTVDRPAAPAATLQNYSTPATVRAGTYPMTIRFYSQAGGAGDVVATATANVTIGADGNGIGDVAVANRITSVAVNVGQTVVIGTPAQLTFSARDANNALVAVSAGSAVWAQLDNANFMTLSTDGGAMGVIFGHSDVNVTVDGVTSPSESIAVANPPVPVFADPGFENHVMDNGTFLQNDAVTGTSWTGDVNWGIAHGGTDWGFTGHDSAQYGYVQIATGSQGSIKQTLTGLVVGHQYRISMWIARQRKFATGEGVGALVTVLANGTQIMTPAGPPSLGNWSQRFTDTFTATQSTYEFTFQAVTPEFPEDQGTLIDDIKLDDMSI